MKAISALVLLVAGGFAYFQPMRWLIESWRVNPYYKHGVVVVLVSIAYAVFKIVRSEKAENQSHQWIYFLTASIVLYLIGFQTGLNFLKTVPIFLTLLAIAHLLGDYLPVRSLRFPILFPIIVIPVPFLPELTAFLQFFMADLSTGILQVFGYEIVAEGATIYLPNATFVIGEPSSGIQSLVALLTLMVPVVYFTKTSLKKKTLLYLMIVPVAMLGNLLRIVTLFLVGYYYGEAVAANFWHDIGGVLFYFSSLIFLFILWYLIVYGCRRTQPNPA